MKPEDYAKTGTEHAHQVALFIWAAQNMSSYPVLKWLYAVPNGGDRHPAVAARLKAEGVKSGVSDLCLPVRRRLSNGLYIEMKKPGGKESASQIEFGAFVESQGYQYYCCDSWDKARDVIVRYLEQV